MHSVYTCTVSSTETILVRVLNAKSGTSANLGQMPQLMVIFQLLLQRPLPPPNPSPASSPNSSSSSLSLSRFLCNSPDLPFYSLIFSSPAVHLLHFCFNDYIFHFYNFYSFVSKIYLFLLLFWIALFYILSCSLYTML